MQVVALWEAVAREVHVSEETAKSGFRSPEKFMDERTWIVFCPSA